MPRQFKYADIKSAPTLPVITFHMEEIQDDHNPPLDKNHEGFWPSRDKESPGYVGENPATSFEEQMEQAKRRGKAWEDGKIYHIAIRAKAEIVIPIGGNSVVSYCLESPGIWGIESDCGEDYKQEVFAQECETLQQHIQALKDAEFKLA